ncbi:MULTISPECIES: hypothetical protein [Wolbachia]|uniref:hypothetical protein n=1 Tax=Wolbachia TaxID=953 RepID=UPI002174D1ED|nr:MULTISPECIES: hypothetical protein [Wolbachia]MBA8756901.1 hypothetical protein [Wolbachia pipientis]MDE5058629.1 hypothetical protein [Wolbachia endosymbiont of Drosophila baimaii]
MIGDVKKLSNEAPIIPAWVPRVRGASLPDGKNSALNYLDIIKNHKLKNKEERDICLVINGPGFEQNQIDDLKRELKEIQGVHVVDLHQYDWSEIDQRWKIDGKDISIKDFFKNMYDMTDEQRTYFAIEIDTFRLIALALSEKMTGQKGAIYVDFDSLKAIDTHIGKGITIPEGILLGSVGAHVDKNTGRIVKTNLNNDLIAISHPRIAVNILSQYKSKILNQKEMCHELVERVSSFMEKTKAKFYASCKELKEKKGENEAREEVKKFIDRGRNLERYLEKHLEDLRNGKIEVLYRPQMFQPLVYFGVDLNLGQANTIKIVHDKLINKEESKFKSVAFPENNGNYVSITDNDLSWTIGEDLYHKQIDNKLERAKVEHSLGEPPLKVVSEANVSSVEGLKLKVNNQR